MINFSDLINPISSERFMAEYHDRQWLHLNGDQKRFDSLMSWHILNELLNCRIWTARTLLLTLDRQRIPAEAYCMSGADRSHQQVLIPEPAQVMHWLNQGASITLNEVESLHGPIRDIARMLEITFGAKSSANIYCSWQAHQAFDSHFDRHDVFALHVLGEKEWNVYRGRAEHPIEHPAFHNIPQSEYDRMKGSVERKITMKPGDFLYLPRGQFHDALAKSGASIHVTFSCAQPIGLDWLNFIWQRAVMDPEFRRYLPYEGKADDGKELQTHVAMLVQRLQTMALAPNALADLHQMRRQFGLAKPNYSLPHIKPQKAR